MIVSLEPSILLRADYIKLKGKKLQKMSRQLPITNYQLPITNYRAIKLIATSSGEL
ncbi:MAG: hypothetical protein HC942_27030 [Microcoleus sp. SU_5_6]|nr:hypothetical protein [Microcoleus sp. SU_5_6]NJS09268.1 hypothetical protein [Microcoleus sp. CSU_2_2]